MRRTQTYLIIFNIKISLKKSQRQNRKKFHCFTNLLPHRGRESKRDKSPNSQSFHVVSQFSYTHRTGIIRTYVHQLFLMIICVFVSYVHIQKSQPLQCLRCILLSIRIKLRGIYTGQSYSHCFSFPIALNVINIFLWCALQFFLLLSSSPKDSKKWFSKKKNRSAQENNRTVGKQ